MNMTTQRATAEGSTNARLPEGFCAGHVQSLVKELGMGYIEVDDGTGRRVAFARRFVGSVFDALAIGSRVIFRESANNTATDLQVRR